MQENNGFDSVKIKLDISSIGEQREFIAAMQEQLRNLAVVVELNRSRMRELQNGPLDNPELAVLMKEFWNDSLMLDLTVSAIIDLADWIHAHKDSYFGKSLEKHNSLKK